MDKVKGQCPQTTTFLKRKESRSGIEPRSFRLPTQRLTARPNPTPHVIAFSNHSAVDVLHVLPAQVLCGKADSTQRAHGVAGRTLLLVATQAGLVGVGPSTAVAPPPPSPSGLAAPPPAARKVRLYAARGRCAEGRALEEDHWSCKTETSGNVIVYRFVHQLMVVKLNYSHCDLGLPRRYSDAIFPQNTPVSLTIQLDNGWF